MLLNSLIRKICAEIVELFFSTIRNDIIKIGSLVDFIMCLNLLKKLNVKYWMHLKTVKNNNVIFKTKSSRVLMFGSKIRIYSLGPDQNAQPIVSYHDS